jgi:hemolysin activation/secretion protein
VQNRLKFSAPGRPAMALAILLAPAAVFAQVTPDAGRILESNKPPVLIAPPVSGTQVLPDAAPPMLAADAGTGRVMVRAFAFEGAAALPAATLQQIVAPYAGRELSFNDMNQAAAAVSAYYRAQGYFLAAAYLPAQDLTRGVVTLRVLEGRVSSLNVVPDASVRLDSDLQRRYLDALVPKGRAVHEDQLERALLLTQDLPGIKARASLSPGEGLGDTAVDVALSEGDFLTGNLGIDNSSNRYTGRTRVTGALNFNDLGGSGAVGSLQLASTGKHFNYARAGLVMPVGQYGTRVGASYSRLRYELGADFAALDASGTAEVGQLLLAHPLIRSRNLNVQVRVGYENKNYENSANGVQTADKRVSGVPIGYDLTAQDSAFGGGSSNVSLEVLMGQVDLTRNAGALAADRLGPDANGSFGRLGYQFGRYQRIGSTGALVAKLSGQMASKNLEAGEKMSLGGPDRVRAYPSGEASGDEGQVLALEGRYGVPAIRSELSVFFDYGRVKLNRRLYPGALAAGGPGNSYDLKGVGAGIQWMGPYRTSVQLQVATKVGSNPARSVDGADVDGSSSRTRAWFQVTSYF